jgi:hypothetical protein
MKSNYLFISIIIYTLCICGTQKAVAQKVYKENNKIILDCGPDSGFPQGAVEMTTGRKLIEPKADEMAENNGDNGTINATVFYKLEIATADISSNTTWVNAYTACKGKGTDENGEFWRLPTQKELILMYIFSTAINNLGNSMSGEYWSSTETTPNGSRYVDFGKGVVYGKTKTYDGKARCVREIPMDPAPANMSSASLK